MSDSSEDEEDVGDDEDEFEDDIEFLRSLDPKECKDQDHYRVLGLAKLRIGATDDQIKRAHRYKVNRRNNKIKYARYYKQLSTKFFKYNVSL